MPGGNYDTANMVVAALDSISWDGIDLGGTTEPYVVTLERTTEDFFSEQSDFPVITRTTEITAESSTRLAQVDLQFLTLAWGMAQGNLNAGSTVLTLDSNARAAAAFTAVGVAGSAGGSGTRTFSFPNTVSSGSSPFNLARTEMAGIDLTVAHNSDNAGSIGDVTDS